MLLFSFFFFSLLLAVDCLPARDTAVPSPGTVVVTVRRDMNTYSIMCMMGLDLDTQVHTTVEPAIYSPR